MPPFKGWQALSWHLINELVAKDFDLVTWQEMLVDHAFTVPVKLFWSDDNRTLLTVPICINTVQFPQPSATRVYALGKAVDEAIQSWDSERKVVVMGTGGLCHLSFAIANVKLLLPVAELVG